MTDVISQGDTLISHTGDAIRIDRIVLSLDDGRVLISVSHCQAQTSQVMTPHSLQQWLENHGGIATRYRQDA